MKRAAVLLSAGLGFFLAPEGFGAASAQQTVSDGAQQAENPFDAMTNDDDLADVIRDGRAILQQRLEEARRREAASAREARDPPLDNTEEAAVAASEPSDTSGWLVFQRHRERRPPWLCKYAVFGLGAGYDPAEALARARQRDTKDVATCGDGRVTCPDSFVVRCQGPGWFAVGMSSDGTGWLACGKESRERAIRELVESDSSRSYFLSGFFTGVINPGESSVMTDSENATFRDMVEEDLLPEWDPGEDC